MRIHDLIKPQKFTCVTAVSHGISPCCCSGEPRNLPNFTRYLSNIRGNCGPTIEFLLVYVELIQKLTNINFEVAVLIYAFSTIVYSSARLSQIENRIPSSDPSADVTRKVIQAALNSCDTSQVYSSATAFYTYMYLPIFLSFATLFAAASYQIFVAL